MSQLYGFHLKAPPIGQRRCPTCGLPMLLSQSHIQPPKDEDGYDERIFECPECAYAETDVVVQYK